MSYADDAGIGMEVGVSIEQLREDVRDLNVRVPRFVDDVLDTFCKTLKKDITQKTAAYKVEHNVDFVPKEVFEQFQRELGVDPAWKYGCYNGPFVEKVRTYQGRWDAWLRDNTSVTLLNKGQWLDSINAYKKELNGLVDEFTKLGGKPTLPKASERHEGKSEGWSMVKVGVYGGLALGAGYLIVKVIEAWKSPSKAKAPGIRGIAVQSPLKSPVKLVRG
jgi:hypothetical protein